MKNEVRQFKIAEILVDNILTAKYIYDPNHHLHPGGGFRKTEKGWTDVKEKSNGRGNQKGKGSHPQRSNFSRRLQEEGLRLPAEVSELFHSGSRKLDEGIRGRLADVLRGELRTRNRRLRYGHEVFVNPKTGKNVNFYANVDGKTFAECFSTCHQYLLNGDCVDVHKEEEYEKTKNYLSEDGLQGISVTEEGDLISVFSLSKEPGFLRTVAPLVKKEVRTLDCFESSVQSLAKMYNKVFGFQTASTLDYNKDFQAADRGKEYADYFEKHYDSPPVHFMVNPDTLDRSKQPNCYNQDGSVKSVHFGKDDWNGAYYYRKALTDGIEKVSAEIAEQNEDLKYIDITKLSPEEREKIRNMTPEQLVDFIKFLFSQKKMT